jgi:AcrR family transcriptional regulator
VELTPAMHRTEGQLAILRRVTGRHCHDLTNLLNSTCDPANSEASMVTQVSPAGTTAMRKPKAPEANRARILAAAIAEFASRGFKGASMDAIAARTSTTRALINYYFRGKEQLYVAVLERVYAEIREAEHHLELEDLPPVEAIRRIVEFTYNYYVEHEDFVRLVVAENQARGRHMKRSPALRTINRPIVDMLGAVIARGRADGAFRPDVDPIDVHMAIAALGMFNVTNQFTFGAIFQRTMGAKGDVPGRRRQVADIILSWLKPQFVCKSRS